MQYNKVFDISNIGEVRNWCKSIEERAKNNEEHAYAHEHAIIIGEDAFNKFKELCPEADGSWNSVRGSNLVNKSKKYELVKAYEVEFYWNARNDEYHGGFTGMTTMWYLVKCEGDLYLQPYTYRDGRSDFSILNDNSDYRNYLPYEWDKYNPAPNNVGTMTDKKMDEWVMFLLNKRNVCTDKYNQKHDKVRRFLDRINNMDASSFDVFECNEKSGRMVKNNVEYKYSISCGVISEDIKLNRNYFTSDDDYTYMQAFLAMAAGRFHSKKKVY